MGGSLTEQQKTHAGVLRAALANKDDAELSAFLGGYALGTAAELMVASMAPPSRRAWLRAMAAKYRDELEQAGEQAGA